MSIMPGRIGHLLRRGGNREAGIAVLVVYYRWPWLASLHWFALAIREYVP
jgi:hypothetical protein